MPTGLVVLFLAAVPVLAFGAGQRTWAKAQVYCRSSKGPSKVCADRDPARSREPTVRHRPPLAFHRAYG